MRRRDFLAAALAGIAFGCIVPERLTAPKRAPRARVAAPILGLNSHTLSPEDLAHLKALGVAYVRTPGILQHWESGLWTTYMAEVAHAAHEADLRLLWVLHNVLPGPVVREPLSTRGGWMERMTAFAAWTASLPATEAVELWNEQDAWVQAPFGASEGLSAGEIGRHYAEQLSLAHPAVRQANPACRVVSGGTAYAPGAFLRGMLSEAPPLDAVAVHAYGPWEVSGRTMGEALREIGSLPLWVSEFGVDWIGARWSEERHLASWQTTVEANEREKLAHRLYGYCLQTDPRSPEHGLLNVNGTPRPAYTWLQERKL